LRAADYDTDYSLVVAKIRERLAVNKQRSQIFHTERFNIKKSKWKVKSSIVLKLLGVISVGFDITYQLLIRFSIVKCV
jgi:hypothetical protein